MRINNPLKSIAMACSLVFLFLGCHSYYEVSKTPVSSGNADSIINANPQRYFILRSGPNAYHMTNITVSADKKTLVCVPEIVSTEHTLHFSYGRGGNMRYKAQAPEKAVLNEIHLYTPLDNTIIPGASYTLSLEQVEKIEVLEKDKGKTTLSYVLGGLGYTIGALAVATVIVAALKSSCPFVSAYNNGEMILQGEIFGGAIYPQLCRDDYVQLQMSPDANGKLRLQISNELKEKQFTDLAELWVVTHPKNLQVLCDEQGNLHTIANPQKPLKAVAAGKDILPLLEYTADNHTYNFNDTTFTDAQNNVSVDFIKPAGVTKAKLILQLKNAYWLDLVYGKMTRGFGSYYNSFIKQQESVPVETLQQWTHDQQLPLTVSILTNRGWQVQQQLTTFGPLASRQIVLPLDLSNTGDLIQLQLSSGFMFWELDYAAIDCTTDALFNVEKLLPEAAIDEAGSNVTQLITAKDEQYLAQPVPGNAAVITYRYAPVHDAGLTQSYFLHARGYYEHVREYPGKPDLTFLEQFKKPAALSKYSRQLFKETVQVNLQALVNNQ